MNTPPSETQPPSRVADPAETTLIETEPKFSWKRAAVSVTAIIGIVILISAYMGSPNIDKLDSDIIILSVVAVASVAGVLIQSLGKKP